MSAEPKPFPDDREELIQALIEEQGCTRESAEAWLGMYNDVIEVGPDDIQITDEDESAD